jgi:hypothetical protein
LGFDSFIKMESVSMWRRAREQGNQAAAVAKKRPYSNAKRQAAAAARQRQQPPKRSHHLNGADPDRLRRVLKSKCCCHRACFQKFRQDNVEPFLAKYWSLNKVDRDSLLSFALGDAQQCGTGGHLVMWQFLGQEVGLACLAKLVGHKKSRLSKAAAGNSIVLDQRCRGRVPDFKLHGELDNFFMTQYLSVAEPLPTKPGAWFGMQPWHTSFVSKTLTARGLGMQPCHTSFVSKILAVVFFRASFARFLHRGRRVGARSLESESDPDEFLRSAAEDEEDVNHWLAAGTENLAFHGLLSNKLACRWLPPGNASSLYQEYIAVQQVRNSRIVSCAPHPRAEVRNS